MLYLASSILKALNLSDYRASSQDNLITPRQAMHVEQTGLDTDSRAVQPDELGFTVLEVKQRPFTNWRGMGLFGDATASQTCRKHGLTIVAFYRDPFLKSCHASSKNCDRGASTLR